VKHHFDNASRIRQCELVKTLLNIPGACCNDSGVISKDCDKPGMLERALGDPLVNHLAAAIPPDQNPNGPNGALTFARIKSQIDNNLPVCFYIQWPDHQVGHFSVISGYNESGGEEYVYVNDPIFGSGPQPYNRVVSNYNLEQGNWQYTYRLKA
jgi:hypothetical protein